MNLLNYNLKQKFDVFIEFIIFFYQEKQKIFN